MYKRQLFICAILVMFMQYGFAAVRFHLLLSNFNLRYQLVPLEPVKICLLKWVLVQLCAGCVRSKNTVNILYKNTMDGLIAGVVFYCFGYGIAFGTKDGEGNAFIGSGDFFLADTAKSGAWVFFFFHWAVVAAVTTIVAGGIAERCRIEAYAIYTCLLYTSPSPRD